jgi:hypothetical protein
LDGGDSVTTVTPTHRVPQDGLRAYTDADASAAPAATLDPGLEVQVLTRWGDWAYIRCTNGWSAWVDGRRLHPMAGQQGAYASAAGAPVAQQQYAPQPQYATQQYAAQSYAPAPAAAPASGLNIGGRSVPITTVMIGVPLLFIGAVLDWFKDGGNSFDVPIKFLFSLEGLIDDTPLTLGWLLLAGAAGAGALALLKPGTNATKSVGSAVLGICVLFGFQVNRFLSLGGDAPGQPGLFSVLGIGLYVAAIGAVLVMINLPLGSRR